MFETGHRLRATRLQNKLSLREVEERSLAFAEEQRDYAYRISASWLNRLERGNYDLTVHKLIVLAHVYGLTSDQLLSITYPEEKSVSRLRKLPGPNAAVPLTTGAGGSQARNLLPRVSSVDNAPDSTHLFSVKKPGIVDTRYRRGVIGKRDCLLEPMVPPGSVVLIDTRQRSIASREPWQHEFQRPIYFFLTQKSYVCGWCDLDDTSGWLTVVAHPLSSANSQRWKYNQEIENLGRIVAITVPWLC